MAFLSSMNITGSGMTAQQLRLDVISENVSNINTTRVEGGDGPYRRKMVVMEADGGRGFLPGSSGACGRQFTAGDGKSIGKRRGTCYADRRGSKRTEGDV